MNLGLLVIRLIVGLTLAAHGSQKLFGWFGGYGIEGTAGFMEQIGFVRGRRSALLAGLAEVGGGLLLALGAATPLAAAAIIGVMVVAIFSVHWAKGFFVTSGGYEYNLVLATTALGAAFAGPGRFSVDRLVGLHVAGPAWGLAALVLGLAASSLQLASRRQVAVQPHGA